MYVIPIVYILPVKKVTYMYLHVHVRIMKIYRTYMYNFSHV